jgi:hypothetical protein
MKPQLNLRIHKFLDGESIESGAIVQVRSMADVGSAPMLHRVDVPVGDDATRHRKLTVEPGRYEVSAVLPSGEFVSRVVDVGEDDENVDAALDAGTSPHEWLSWQQWSGNIADPHSRQSAPVLAAQPTPADITFIRVPASGAAPREPLWTALADALAELQPAHSIAPDSITPPSASTGFVDVMHDPAYVAVRLPRGVGGGPERAYLFVTLHGQTMLCAMPWPWPQSDHSGEALVETVIAEEMDPLDGPSWSARTIVRDHRVASLLSYFSSGEQRTARELVAPARGLLFGKQMNSLAATAGAYILVGEWIDESTRGTMKHDWMDWVRNLSSWFPWIPDGAILEGWLALRMRGREPNIEQARAALLEAERRGIPLYSAGVRRLVDGLMLIAGTRTRTDTPDPELHAALTRVRQLAWQIDPGQPFTCVRLWAP